MPSVLFIGPQTQSEEQFLFAPAHGARVYAPRPTTVQAKDPDDVYMLYLSVRGTGFFRRHYRTKRGSTPANDVAKILCDYAKQGNNKYEIGKDLVDVKWNSSSYLYIVVDINGCRFVDDQNEEKYDPLHFHESKGIPCTTSTFYFDRNAAFYEGQILADSVLGAPAFRCINHFTDEHDMPLRHPRIRTYGFEIRYWAPSGLEIVDPDGQNQGPPA